MSNFITDSESQYPIYIYVPLQLFVYLLPFESYSTRQFWLGFPYTGANFGGFGARGPPKLEL